jgi:hypothetical protein
MRIDVQAAQHLVRDEDGWAGCKHGENVDEMALA